MDVWMYGCMYVCKNGGRPRTRAQDRVEPAEARQQRLGLPDRVEPPAARLRADQQLPVRARGPTENTCFPIRR